MSIHPSAWIFRRKWILAAIGLPVLVALWWAFRPEKLWINQKVDEAAPFDTGADPRPILTGRFESKAQQTSGRATVYKKPGGAEFLHLSDFTVLNIPDAHVELTRAGDRIPEVDLGPLKSSPNQNYGLPAPTDLNKYNAVVIFSERFHSVVGLARLEPF